MNQKEILFSTKKFYQSYPYPSQKIISKENLFSSKHEFIMRKILNCANLTKSSLSNLDVLDAGCGTGEKSLYLANFKANVDAFDLSTFSIKIAKKNAKKLNLKINFFTCSFEKFKAAKKYDLILCIGSLHHSANAKKNFLKLSSYLKKDGVMVLGLYNLYGRFFHRIKRFLLKFFLKNPPSIIKFLNALFRPKTKTGLILLADKYASPYESYHTIEEILDWFKEAGLEPIKVYPSLNFQNKLNLILGQFYWLVLGKGFFFISGKQNIK